MDIEKEVWRMLNPLLTKKKNEMESNLSLLPNGELKKYIRATWKDALNPDIELDIKKVNDNIDKLMKDAN